LGKLVSANCAACRPNATRRPPRCTPPPWSAGYWFRDVSVPEPDAAAPPPSNQLTEAEQYAILYPDRAARIRANRGLPTRLDFGPPEPHIIEAIVRGTSPILRALDKPREEVVSA
jgi:hypothetical protein